VAVQGQGELYGVVRCCCCYLFLTLCLVDSPILLELVRRQEEQMQAIRMSLLTIGSNVKVTSHNLTPSSDCKSCAEPNYTSLMETIDLDRSMNILSGIGECEEDSLLCEFREHSFTWGEKTEDSSYPGLIEYLTEVGMFPHDVSHGQNLPHGHLFSSSVHTLRKNTGVSSQILRSTGAEPKLKFTVSGTSDVAVLKRQDSLLSRTHCDFCVEVKRVIDMAGDANTNKALREGVLQLIGLNAGNPYASPSVIVTNLQRKHYLLFISRGDEPDVELSFHLNIKRYKSFAQVLYHAKTLSERGCVTHEFGSPPTPEQSNEERDDDCSMEGKVDVILT